MKTPPPEPVVLYARISTREGKQYLSNQLADLNRRAAREGWRIVETITDEHTGAAAAPGWNRVLQMAQARKMKRVAVWRLDRVTRQGPAHAFAQIHNLSQFGVQLTSIQEPMFDAGGNFGPVLIAVAAWIAEQESIVMSERVRAGLSRAKQQGKKLGRPRLVYDRQKLADLRAQGFGLDRIARALNVHRASANRYIKEYERTRNHDEQKSHSAPRPDETRQHSRTTRQDQPAGTHQGDSTAIPTGGTRPTHSPVLAINSRDEGGGKTTHAGTDRTNQPTNKEKTQRSTTTGKTITKVTRPRRR